jgi:3-oxoacyl-[acyl-carrier protein] reductase
VALALGRRGAAVVVNYLEQKALAEGVAADVEAGGGRALVHRADVRDREAVRAMVERTVETLGGLDILVNNARLLHAIRPFLELDWDRDMRSQLEIHLAGAFHCCQAAIPHMMRPGGGAIVNVLSTAFRSASPRHHAYGPAKAALRTLTMNLAVEMGPHGIRVTPSRPPPPRPRNSPRASPRTSAGAASGTRRWDASPPPTRWPMPSSSSAPPAPATSREPTWW